MNSDDGLESVLLARIAACNFDNTIFDTDDLSTIRGSSLFLLRFPDTVVQRLQRDYPDVEATEISSGASELLFRFAATPAAREIVEKFLSELLARHPGNEAALWSRFTFVWAVEESGHGIGQTFSRRLDHLIAQCNLRQYQQPTVMIPEFHSDAQRQANGEATDATSVVCHLDGISPASPDLRQKSLSVSRSVYQRRSYGRQAKQNFYGWELGDLNPADQFQFVQEFSLLAPTAEELCREEIPESLRGKIALVYLDGNSFGRKRAELGTTAQGLQQFSTDVKAHRRDLLRTILASLVTTPGFTLPAEQDDSLPALRFETLLWGGDEVMWVLPAWLVWDFMGIVQKHLNDHSIWRDLKHGAGVLIAPYKAPIRDLTALVRDLGDTAKTGNGRGMNGVQIGLVKGFDLPGVTVNDLRGPLFAPNGTSVDIPHSAFQLDGARWDDIRQAMARVKDPDHGLPRSSLYRMYQDALHRGLFAADRTADAIAHRDAGIQQIELVHEGKSRSEAIAVLRNGFPGATGTDTHPLLPLHLVLQLWDIAR